MPEERTRVGFNALQSLVDQADRVADVLDISRTQLLVQALQDELAALAEDEQFQQRLTEAFYDDRVDYQMIEALLGTGEAIRLELLRESINREPPEPYIDDGMPSTSDFYDGERTGLAQVHRLFGHHRDTDAPPEHPVKQLGENRTDEDLEAELTALEDDLNERTE